MSNWFQSMKRAVNAPSKTVVAVRPFATLEVDQAKPQRVILLPPRGVVAGAGGFAARATPPALSAPLAARTYLRSLVGLEPQRPRRAGVSALRLKVVDSVAEDGAKLVEMIPDDLALLRIEQPGLRIIPELFYAPAVHLYFVEDRIKAKATASAKSVTITVVGTTGEAVAGAAVVAFTDFQLGQGVDGITNASGRVTLTVPSSVKQFERFYVYPEHGYWGSLRKNVVAATNMAVRLTPIDPGYTDGVRHFYGRGADQEGTGVKVAIIDSGIALDHPELSVAGGACTISGEPENAFGALGGPHGTHVAGIVAARGNINGGLRGIAPGVELRSYRVFPPDSGASNFWIIKAIDRAVQDGCDLINLSLGGGPRDSALESAIGDAHLAGSVCVVAAGNDNRNPVSVPAAYQLCLAVSAMGRKGTFPTRTTESGDVAAPYGTDAKNFLAAFSNLGPEIDVTGPGVGIISTVPGGLGVMSGTSMACPAITGVAARMLGRQENRAILMGPRDENRANSIIQAVLSSCRLLGLKPKPDCEGSGMPTV